MTQTKCCPIFQFGSWWARTCLSMVHGESRRRSTRFRSDIPYSSSLIVILSKVSLSCVSCLVGNAGPGDTLTARTAKRSLQRFPGSLQPIASSPRTGSSRCLPMVSRGRRSWCRGHLNQFASEAGTQWHWRHIFKGRAPKTVEVSARRSCAAGHREV